MTRTLPWKNGDVSGGSNLKRTHQGRQQTVDGSDPDTGPGHAAKSRKLRAVNRTPSTSPPPLPPSQHKMRPGFDADDIYIMVEDEFLATAQLFTRHLHHAEYVRLKAEASKRGVEAVKHLARPVDTRTIAREETRRKKQAEALSAKIKSGLEDLGVRKTASESDQESEKCDEPWHGTHLQRFMTESPKKGARTLIGLQGQTSNTRAAAGFRRAEKGKTTRMKAIQFDAAREMTTKSGGMLNETGGSDDEIDDEEEDDDDLDRPVIRSSTVRPAFMNNKHELKTNKQSSIFPKEPSTKNKIAPTSHKRAFLDLSPPSPEMIKKEPEPEPEEWASNRISSSTYVPIRRDSPDSLPMISKNDTIRQRMRESKERRDRERKQDTNENRRGGGGGHGNSVTTSTDEIPLFII